MRNDERGLELSPTKLDLIKAHFAERDATTGKGAGGHASGGSPTQSHTSTVLSGGFETEAQICLHNSMMGLKVLLVVSTVCGFGGIYILARQQDPSSAWPFTRDQATELLRNIPIGFLSFFVADTVAYFIMRQGELWDDEDSFEVAPTNGGKRPALWRRALAALLSQSLQAGVIGAVSLGVVDTLWLSRLNVVFPAGTVGVGSSREALRLLYKSLLDSLVYGAAANSWGIIARRVMFNGESIGKASAVWDERILSVMAKELAFWPAWNAVNFLMVPRWAQVAFVGVGGLCWNIYISLEARRNAWRLEGYECLDDPEEPYVSSEHDNKDAGAAGAAGASTRIETRMSSAGMTTKFTTLAPTPPSHACTPLAAHRVEDAGGRQPFRAQLAARHPLEGRISSPVPSSWRRRAAAVGSPPASAARRTPVSRWMLWQDAANDSPVHEEQVRARLAAAADSPAAALSV